MSISTHVAINHKHALVHYIGFNLVKLLISFDCNLCADLESHNVQGTNMLIDGQQPFCTIWHVK